MATREKRLAQFDGSGEPPPDQPVEVLCEDHSGTYQLPFRCRWIDGQWRNEKTGGAVEATAVGWRLPRTTSARAIRDGRSIRHWPGAAATGRPLSQNAAAKCALLRSGTRM